MKTRREAKEFVYALTAKSLRGLAGRLTAKQCPEGTTPAGVERAKKELEALAAKLDKAFPKGDIIEG